MEEKQTLFTRLEKEAEAYLANFIKECKVVAITDRAVQSFMARYLCLNFKWMIEHLLIMFLEIFLLIVLWRTKFEFEVRTVARVLSSAGILVFFSYFYHCLKVKHLDDVVKMEVKFFKKNQNQIKLEEDTDHGRGQAE
jgi:hypothetical protein